MATQLQHFALTALIFIIPWLCICFNAVPAGISSLLHLNSHRLEWTVGAPVVVLAALGFYAMGSVIYGVYTFNDCPEARRELIGEIEEAKRDLRRRRVI